MNPQIAKLFCHFMADTIDGLADEWITDFEESLQGEEYDISEGDIEGLFELVQIARNSVATLK